MDLFAFTPAEAGVMGAGHTHTMRLYHMDNLNIQRLISLKIAKILVQPS
jgi:hypothetical protein